MGFGQSGQETKSNTNLNNLFNFALPESQKQQSAGSRNLGTAGDFFSKLLTAGRADTAQRSAPAVDAALAQSDAARRREATAGTGRTGGTAELNREAGANTNATIDQIINNNLVGGQTTAAAGLESVGGTQTSNAGQLLGLAESGQTSALGDAIAKEGSQSGVFGGLLNTGAEAGASFAVASALGLI